MAMEPEMRAVLTDLPCHPSEAFHQTFGGQPFQTTPERKQPRHCSCRSHVRRLRCSCYPIIAEAAVLAVARVVAAMVASVGMEAANVRAAAGSRDVEGPGASIPVRPDLELDGVADVEDAVAVAPVELERRLAKVDVPTAVVGSDEAGALGGIKPPHHPLHPLRQRAGAIERCRMAPS
jgi:hypothetical protein